ncbi:hypothetical protein FOCC_FOCC013709 [Frankliniella occidentalis]|nr:hypothetical protein FOCC_FOCC013709 [Frankliniella occidentalis]
MSGQSVDTGDQVTCVDPPPSQNSDINGLLQHLYKTITCQADRFPLLAMLARQYLSIPASSAETERTFSEAGWILNKRRKRLCMTTVDDLIILHANCKDRIRERLSKRKRRKGPD